MVGCRPQLNELLQWDAVFGDPTLNVESTVGSAAQRGGQLALEIRLRPGRVPHRDQDRIRMARGELTKRQNDEILGFPKLDLAARENVKAARVEQAGARARKEERGIDTFMDQRDRLVAQRAQNVCGPVRRAQQTVIRCELLCNFDA